MKLVSGTKLGPYEIREEIGAGGMGEVYRARDSRLGRDVAIKISPERFSERFEREARAVAALNHPNICTLHDVGSNYLVMELVEGKTLSNLITSPLPLDTALNYARQIAAALEAAHEKGIVHRDLKPSNIKIKPDDTVKVLDFGLAKVNSTLHTGTPDDSPTNVPATQAGIILGTAAYMSPEQARGQTVDKRADIWAFGVVLYEMLAGKQLFQEETISDTLASVLKNQPNLNEIPLEARRLLQCCLEKDPSRRLRDIGDAKLLLEPLPKTQARPNGAAPWAVAAVLLIAVVIAMWAPWRKSVPTDRPTVSVDLDAGPGAMLLDASGPTMILSPDGTRLVFVAQQSGNKSSLFTRRLDHPNAAPIAGSTGAHGPFFSPDGQWVGFFADGKMKKISVEGGEAVTLCDAPAGRGASWGDDDRIDGRWLAYASTESGGYEVYVRAYPDNGSRWRVSNSGGMHPVWSRSGRELFYKTDNQRIMVATYTAKGDAFISDRPRLWSEKTLANTGLNPTFDLAPDGKRIAALMPVANPEAAQTQGHVTLLVNFFDELRRRMSK